MTVLAQTGSFQWALQPTKYGNGTLVAAKAQARYALSALPTAADTVVIAAVTYTYRVTSTGADDVTIGADAATTIANLAAAVNAGAGSGTAYGAGTSANVAAVAIPSNQTLILNAAASGVAGNALALSATGSVFTLTPWAGGITAGAFKIALANWRKHRANDIDYDAVQEQKLFPLEVGGAITPTGDYKSGVYLAGGATLLPRLESEFGELLLAALGASTTTANSPESGVNTHVFHFRTDYQDEIPWISLRKMIAGKQGVRGQGITGYDNKVAQFRLMLPQNDIVQARMDFIGRVPKYEPFPETWLSAGAYEDFPSVPISCKGSFTIPTQFTGGLPVTSVVIELVNNVTSPREEMIVGSYFMDDMVVRSRSMQIRFIYKWADPSLYELINTGTVNGTDWSPAPFITTYDGTSNYAFQAHMESPQVIPSKATPFSLDVRAASVAWQANGPVMLRGGGIIQQEYIGTVLAPVNANYSYADFILVNQASSYTVPALT